MVEYLPLNFSLFFSLRTFTDFGRVWGIGRGYCTTVKGEGVIKFKRRGSSLLEAEKIYAEA